MVAKGCPRNPDGSFSLADVQAWLREKADKRDAAASLKDQKLEHEIQRLKRDIEARDLDIAKSRGALHSRAECAASLSEIRAAESRVLMGLGQRIAAQFPENGAAIMAAIDKDVREMLARLHGGEAYTSVAEGAAT
jgi:hypothetical protein